MSKKINKINQRLKIGIYDLFILMAIIIAFPWYGLYGELQYIPFSFGLAILIVIFFVKKREELSFELEDLLLALLVIAYSISLLNAANPREAYLQIIKQASVFAVYILTKNIFKNEESRKYLFGSLILSVSIVTFITMLSKAGFMDPLYMSHNRFSGTIAYSNTYAAVLAATILIGFAIIDKVSLDSKKKYLVVFLTLLNVYAFYGTNSRGGFLIYLIGIALTLFLFPKNNAILFRNNLILYNLIGMLLLVITNNIKGIAYLIISISMLLLFSFVLLKQENITHKLINIVFLKYLIIFSSLILFLAIIKTSVLSRLINFNFSDIDMLYRLFYYEDGFNIFRENMLIGTGGGGWLTLYPLYQEHCYVTTETHSYLLQLLIETGIIGTSIFLFFVVAYTLRFINKKKAGETVWTQNIAFIASVILLLHSFIDFDMSFVAVSMIFIIMVSLVSKGPSEKTLKTKIKQKHYFPLAAIIIVFLLVSTGLLQIGYLMTFEIKDTISNSEYLDLEVVEEMKQKFRFAALLDPFNASNYGYIGQLNIALAQINNDQTLYEEGLSYMDKTISLQPTFFKNYIVRGHVLRDLKRYEDAINDYKAAAQLIPLNNQGYEVLLEQYVNIARETKINSYLYDAIKETEGLRSKMAKVSDERKRRWIGDYLGYSGKICFWTGIAHYYIGEYEKGLEYFYEALESKSFKNDKDFQKLTSNWIAAGDKLLKREPSVSYESQIVAEIINEVTKDQQ